MATVPLLHVSFKDGRMALGIKFWLIREVAFSATTTYTCLVSVGNPSLGPTSVLETTAASS